MSDPQRPRYHFLPPSDWMNDPNGVLQWAGRYHLFYQFSPGRFSGLPNQGASLPGAHWGHAVSDDLLHWEHLPIALAPTPGGADPTGCYSGCAVDHDGVPTIIYTGVMPQKACIATGSDDLITWTKHPANPVIPAPPEGLEVPGWRDHCVWREDDGWYQVIGCGVRGVGGALPLYRSPDLVRWEYLGLMCTGDANLTGSMWEVPDFFPLGDQHVLTVHAHPEWWFPYFVGSYVDHRYHGEFRGRVDLGTHYAAPQTLLDSQGRRLAWGWIREGRTREAQAEAGWSGLLSLPRVLGLDANGRLTSEPVPELRALRGAHHAVGAIALAHDSAHEIQGVAGAQLEILAEFTPAPNGTVGLAVRRSPDGAEETRIEYNYADGRLTIDCQQSSLDLSTDRPSSGGPLHRPPDTPLRLHVFLDASVVEVFAHGRVATSRIYPTRSDSLGLQVFSSKARPSATFDVIGQASLTSLDIWELDAIWDGSESIPVHT